MRLVTTPRVAVLRAVADGIIRRYGRGRMIVAVAGPAGADAAALADDLRDVLAEHDHAVFRASEAGFHRSREAQAAFGQDTPERYVRHGIDESALLRSLVEPFRLGGSTAFVTRVLDPARDAWVEPRWLTGPEDAILVIDGRFMLRERLARLWDYRIAIDGEPADPADVIAYAEQDPRAVADVVLDLTDPARPRLG
ncbi:nucleoside/nucleotide kinase family protein [Agromyces aerolatus]|uniref:hypothetical protein n=1 Tax=Agromyces sp. LY-1074 TaxID=3074080 RepID=UPI002862D0EA|nr:MULTISPECIES: hypothetical protein [unclassified Agromyces]MDR5701337.1 hypothetical protein [Agromyces sp. LY-1074]MDR5707595.1 hypothetical protein [Agromyces sp. LY-1358]